MQSYVGQSLGFIYQTSVAVKVQEALWNRGQNESRSQRIRNFFYETASPGSVRSWTYQISAT